MKVVHVVESLDTGGLERVVVNLCAGDTAMGNTSQVICIFEGGRIADELEAAGTQIDIIGKRDGLDLDNLLRLRRIIRDAQPDLIHTHNPVANYFTLASLLFSAKPKVINTRHGMGGPADFRREKIYKQFMRWTEVCVTVCHAAAERFAETGIVAANKIQVIGNSIDTGKQYWPDRCVREKVRTSLGYKEDDVVFASAARLNEIKNHEMLIAAFSALEDQRAHLLLIGDGPLRTELEQQSASLHVGDRVRFLGDREDARELLLGSDAFVMSSVSEGYSMALLEASLAGLAIVATDVGGNGEIVQAEQTGLLVPSEDPAAFAAAMQQLMDPTVRSAYGSAGFAWATQNASIDGMRESYQNLYTAVVCAG